MEIATASHATVLAIAGIGSFRSNMVPRLFAGDDREAGILCPDEPNPHVVGGALGDSRVPNYGENVEEGDVVESQLNDYCYTSERLDVEGVKGFLADLHTFTSMVA